MWISRMSRAYLDADGEKIHEQRFVADRVSAE
jgi:hypothetical protein